MAAEKNESNTLPLKSLLRSRFLWQFTLSKVFSDPVWYFYTFWFPEYLKVVHGFSLRQIGETAWIPFFTAAIGNLAGGAVFSGLLRRGTEAAATRRIAVLILSPLMVPAVLVGANPKRDGVYRSNFDRDIRLLRAHWQTCSPFPGTRFRAERSRRSGGSPAWAPESEPWSLALLTGWLVDRYSFHPVFVLFGILPVISAWIVWTLPKTVSPDAVLSGRALDDAHGHAAINHKVFSGNEVVLDQGHNHMRNFFGLAFPMQWDSIIGCCCRLVPVSDGHETACE